MWYNFCDKITALQLPIADECIRYNNQFGFNFFTQQHGYFFAWFGIVGSVISFCKVCRSVLEQVNLQLYLVETSRAGTQTISVTAIALVT